MASTYSMVILSTTCLKMFLFAIGLVQFVYFSGVASQSHTNFKVIHVELCSPSKGPVQLRYVNVTNTNGKQYLNWDTMTQIPIDENVGVTCSIEHAANGKTFIPLFTIREKSFCKASNMYMGEFWYDIERAAQLSPGVCPIQPGVYRVHEHFMDFRKVSLQTFPFGKLKLTFSLINNRNGGSVYTCVMFEVQNTLQ